VPSWPDCNSRARIGQERLKHGQAPQIWANSFQRIQGAQGLGTSRWRSRRRGWRCRAACERWQVHAGFKSYDQGRAKWQAETLDFVWFDEEPPMDLYTEGLTRTNATQGIVWLTFADTHPPHVSPRRQARRRRTDTT